MKKNSLFALFFLWTSFVLAQGELEVAIRLVDTKQLAIVNQEVILKESVLKKEIKAMTGADGVAVFKLNEGDVWNIFYYGHQHNAPLTMPGDGKRGRTKVLITYNPAKIAQDKIQKPARNTIQFSVTNQRRKSFSNPTKGMAVVNLIIMSTDGYTPSAQTEVALVQLDKGLRFEHETDSYGHAEFLVPVGLVYEVDVNGLEAFSIVKVPASEGLILTHRTMYEATKIKEKEKNDTITQTLPQNMKTGTSDRVLVLVKIKGMGENERVFLDEIKGKKVYLGRTNSESEVFFLLPKGKKYMIHFDFQRDVDVVDVLNMAGIGRYERVTNYRPDPKLQFPLQFIPTPDQLLVQNFDEFLTKQFPAPEKGKKIDFFFRWGNTVNEKSKEALLELGFSTQSSSEHNKNAPPINISFVMDKSGSMAGYERIETLKLALAEYVKKKFAQPTTFRSSVSTTKRQCLCHRGKLPDRAGILEAIAKIEAGGGTYMFDALKMGYKELLKRYKPKGTNRLILLTDGYDSTDVPTIVNAFKAYNARGLELSAVGVGQDYNQALLKLLATQGGGLLHFTGTAQGIETVFAQELESVLRPFASQATFEIEFNKRIIFKELYGFEAKVNNRGQAVFEMNKLYAGLNKIALVKFDLHKPTPDIENEPVIMRLRYTNLETGKEVIDEKRTYLKWQDYTGTPEIAVDREQKKLYAIAIMNQTLKTMAEAYALGKKDKARAVLTNTYAEMKALYPQADDTDIRALMQRIDTYIKALEQQQKNDKNKF